jgi:hypothetical protein
MLRNLAAGSCFSNAYRRLVEAEGARGLIQTLNKIRSPILKALIYGLPGDRGEARHGKFL